MSHETSPLGGGEVDATRQLSHAGRLTFARSSSCASRLLDSSIAIREILFDETLATQYSLDAGAFDFLNALGRSIHECELPSDLRVRMAAGCLAVAQDHHHSIVVLLDNRLYASCFALVRCQFEAYVRGEWLALCATDDEVDAFANAHEPPSLARMVEALERTPAFAEMVLSKIKANSRRSMCAYTHTGGLHVQRWATEDAIEPNYDEAEVNEVLAFAEVFGALAVLGVANLADDQRVAESVFAKFVERMAPESPMGTGSREK